MSKYKSASVIISLRHAVRGLFIAFKSQKNFQIDLITGIAIISLAVVLKLSLVKISILIFLVGFMLFAELVNTVIEFTIDAYFKNKYSILAKMSKDLAAAAVLISAISSAIIGFLVFLPEIQKLLVLLFSYFE